MLTYCIDKQRRMVVLTGSGALSVTEVLDWQKQVHADPAFDPSFTLLADYRDATTIDFDTAQLRIVAQNVPFGPAVRRAFVVRQDADYGVLRMFQTLSEVGRRRGNVAVFRDLQLALQWLEGGSSD